jgi:hypothetical protein
MNTGPMDGSFNGVRYFNAPPGHGVMIPLNAGIVTFEESQQEQDSESENEQSSSDA